MTASKLSSNRSLGSDLAKVAAHVIQPEEYEELPELTEEMLARGNVKKGAPTFGEPQKVDIDTLARGRNFEVASDRAGLANAHGGKACPWSSQVT
jgi:hypothetical protein